MIRCNINFRYECKLCRRRFKRVNWACDHNEKKHWWEGEVQAY